MPVRRRPLDRALARRPSAARVRRENAVPAARVGLRRAGCTPGARGTGGITTKPLHVLCVCARVRMRACVCGVLCWEVAATGADTVVVVLMHACVRWRMCVCVCAHVHVRVCGASGANTVIMYASSFARLCRDQPSSSW